MYATENLTTYQLVADQEMNAGRGVELIDYLLMNSILNQSET